MGVGCALLFAVVAVALGRDVDWWGQMPALVWAHLLLLMVALALTPVLLFGMRGNRRHRQLGWVWAVSLFATAALSFGLHGLNGGGAPYTSFPS